MTKDQFSEPDKKLEDIFAQYITGPINESTTNAAPTDEEDENLDVLDQEFEALFESIVGTSSKVINENADIQFEDDEFSDEVSPQDGGELDELDEFNQDDESLEGGEEEMISLPLSQLRGLYDTLSQYFGDGAEGGEEGEIDDLSEFDDVLPENDSEVNRDEIPMESCKGPASGKKLLDSKKTNFKSNASVKSPTNKATVHDKRPKTFNIKSKAAKLVKKNK